MFSLFLFWIYFRGIGDHGLIDPVEGINASIALHMSAGNNYFVPKIGASLASGCTMGTWWLNAVALKIFGWSEFAVRFWSALSGLGMILASALSARRYPNENSRKSWLASCICASMILCFAVSQISSSHAIYSCLTALAMAGIIKSKQNKKFLILSHISITFAFISHGASGLFLPFLAVIIYSVLCEDWDLLKDFFTWPGGIIITILISGLYFLLLMLMEPSVIFYMICRGHNYNFGGVQGIIFFVLMSLTPFHGFIIQAIFEILHNAEIDNYPLKKSPELFMLIWALLFGTAAIISGNILAAASMLPALSAILGRRLDYWFDEKFSSVRYSVMMNFLILIPLLYIALPITVKFFPVVKSSLMSLIPYEILMGLFIFASWYYTKTKQIKKWIRNVSAAALLCLMPLAGVFNLTAENYSMRDTGLKLRDIIKGNETVLQYGVNYPSMYFYTLRNSNIIDAELNLGIEEKKFVTEASSINRYWNRNERVFLLIPLDKRTKLSMTKNIFHILEADGLLLLSNK